MLPGAYEYIVGVCRLRKKHCLPLPAGKARVVASSFHLSQKITVNMAKPSVFFDMTADGQPMGRVVMEVRLRIVFFVSLLSFNFEAWDRLSFLVKVESRVRAVHILISNPGVFVHVTTQGVTTEHWQIYQAL